MASLTWCINTVWRKMMTVSPTAEQCQLKHGVVLFLWQSRVLLTSPSLTCPIDNSLSCCTTLLQFDKALCTYFLTALPLVFPVCQWSCFSFSLPLPVHCVPRSLSASHSALPASTPHWAVQRCVVDQWGMDKFQHIVTKQVLTTGSRWQCQLPRDPPGLACLSL